MINPIISYGKKIKIPTDLNNPCKKRGKWEIFNCSYGKKESTSNELYRSEAK